MRDYEQDYRDLVATVIANGAPRESRAGPTRAMFGRMLTIDCMRYGRFPLLTGRKMYYTPVLGELAAFLRGAEYLYKFKDFGCNYWDANAAAWPPNAGLPLRKMAVGKIYGYQWRHWRGWYDQLATLVTNLKCDPFSRRHVLTTYEPTAESCLPPCHLLAQFNVTNSNCLDCIVYMRSVDLCLGLPSDVVLYAALQILVAAKADYGLGTLTFMLADTHIYEDHILTFEEYMLASTYGLPSWRLAEDVLIDTFIPGNLEIINYNHGYRYDFPFHV